MRGPFEDPGHLDLQAVLPPIVKKQGFRATLALIVAGARPDRVNVAPIIFSLRVDARIAIDFGRGRLENSCPQTFCKSQHVDCAVHTGFRRLHWVVLVVDRRSRTCEIVNLIDFHVEWEGDIVPDQFEMRMNDQVFDVPSRSSEEIVDAENDRAICQQALAQVRTEEASTAGNQYACF
jgi:hypothetical protein